MDGFDAIPDSDDSGDGNETPDASEVAEVSLHSACISPSPDDVHGIVAAMVRQRRAAAWMASPPA